VVDLVCFDSFYLLCFGAGLWAFFYNGSFSLGHLCLLACASRQFKTCDLRRFNKKDDVWIVSLFLKNAFF